jgi:hypothetical protein
VVSLGIRNRLATLAAEIVAGRSDGSDFLTHHALARIHLGRPDGRDRPRSGNAASGHARDTTALQAIRRYPDGLQQVGALDLRRLPTGGAKRMSRGLTPGHVWAAVSGRTQPTLSVCSDGSATIWSCTRTTSSSATTAASCSSSSPSAAGRFGRLRVPPRPCEPFETACRSPRRQARFWKRSAGCSCGRCVPGAWTGERALACPHRGSPEPCPMSHYAAQPADGLAVSA